MTSSKEIRAAGCLVYRLVGAEDSPLIEVLIAHRPKYDDWDLPKGHVEPGESDRQAALREVYEEVGVTGTIISELPDSTYTVNRRGENRLKRIKWWLMLYEHGEFQPNDEVDEVRWVEISKAGQVLSYGNVEQLLSATIALLVK